MTHEALSARVARIRRTLELCARDSRNSLEIQPVPPHVLQRLAATAGFPADMLAILSEIGEMRRWSMDGCAVIDWWVPCKIKNAIDEGRCDYDVRESNFIDGHTLLFFAWDCHAKVYFYDVNARPWNLVASDGLSLSERNVPNDPDANEPCPAVSPWEEESDAISIIESWVEWAERLSRED